MSRSSTSSSDAAADREPVVATRPDATAAGSCRAVAIVATAVFGLVVFGSAGVDLLAPLPAPQLVGAELELQQAQRSAAHFGDGSLAHLCEAELRARSRVRRTAQAIWAPLLLRAFGDAGPAHVLGRDGFLFRRDRIAVSGRPRGELLDQIGGRFTALSRWLGHLGTRLLVLPLPRKAVAMGRLLPTDVDAHADLDREVADRLSRDGVPFVDLLPTFLAAADPVYLPGDSHWSSAGMLLAARAVAAALGVTATEPRLQRVRRGDGASLVAHALGLDPLAERLLPASDYQQDFVVDRTRVHVLTAPPAAGPTPLLLVGTSFSKHATGANTLFPELLSVLLAQPIWNGAAAGITGTEALARALAQLGDRPLPSTILLEEPDHYLVGNDTPLADLGEAFARLPLPAAFAPLATAPGAGFDALPFAPGCDLAPGEHRIAVGTWRSAYQQLGSFVHPRDGTLALVLRGRVTGPPLLVNVDVGADNLHTEWTSEQSAVHLPIAGGGLATELVIAVVAERGDSHFALDAIEIDTDLAFELAQAGSPHAAEGPESLADGWRARFGFATATGDGCLAIAIDEPEGAAAARTVDAVLADGAGEHLFGPTSLPPQTRLLLPLRADGALRTVTVAGAGPPPSRPIRVWFVPRRQGH